MIETFFNFKRLPFSKEIKAADLLETEPLRELKARLEHVRKHRGLFLLTGAPGTGKTAALRAWVAAMSQTNHKIVYVSLGTISSYDLFFHLNDSFGGALAHRKGQLFKSLQKAIQDWVEASRRLPILILDDAHELPSSTLLELPMLLNFKMDSYDPIIVVLAGHERLAASLRRPHLRHLDQRIMLRFDLATLDEEATDAYLTHHLQLVGGKPTVFDEAARLAIHQVARGTLRLINRIALDALTVAATQRCNHVTNEHVYAASKQI